MDRRAHWNSAWSNRSPETVSWYQRHPEPSLRLIKRVAVHTDPTIDVGGGASELAGALAAEGYVDVTVLDVSGAALAKLTSRLEGGARRVRTVEADVLDYDFAPGSVALWHDRAVFHFLTDSGDRARYRKQLASAVLEGGHVVLGTFAADGPTQCSGLPVQRYDSAALAQELGPNWQVIETVRHEHVTPSGALQPFTFVLARHVARLVA
jgi:SAM-dependent methyltransferase